MKKISALTIILTVLTINAFAQSNSFRILKNKFDNSEEVQVFSVGGWLCKLVFGLAGEYEFKKAVEDIDHIRLLTIPRKEFEMKEVTVTGFKRMLAQDNYEQLAQIHEKGEDVTIYLKEMSNHKNYYFVLVESDSEVVAIEIKGYINPEVLKDNKLAMIN